MTKSEFNKHSIEDRYKLLKQSGEFIGSKKRESYFIHLFTLEGLYIEMWRPLSTNQTQWIEVTENLDNLSDYVKEINLF